MVSSTLADVTPYTPSHLDWPGLLNARDLGGMPLSDGGTVADRALVRSESLTWLDPAGVEAARAYGPVRVVDLRRPVETGRYPHPFAVGDGAGDGDPEYLNVPVQEPGDPEEGPWDALYVGMLERRPDLFARAVGAIADAPPGPVLVHCSAGKDRTGIVVAFALSLAGVEDELIADDYVITNTRIAPRFEQFVAAQDRHRAEHAERVAALRAAADPAADEITLPVWLDPARSLPPGRNVILDTLAAVRARHGSVAGYLDSGGLSSEQREALVLRLRGHR